MWCRALSFSRLENLILRRRATRVRIWLRRPTTWDSDRGKTLRKALPGSSARVLSRSRSSVSWPKYVKVVVHSICLATLSENFASFSFCLLASFFLYSPSLAFLLASSIPSPLFHLQDYDGRAHIEYGELPAYMDPLKAIGVSRLEKKVGYSDN